MPPTRSFGHQLVRSSNTPLKSCRASRKTKSSVPSSNVAAASALHSRMTLLPSVFLQVPGSRVVQRFHVGVTLVRDVDVPVVLHVRPLVHAVEPAAAPLAQKRKSVQAALHTHLDRVPREAHAVEQQSEVLAHRRVGVFQALSQTRSMLVLLGNGSGVLHDLRRDTSLHIVR